MSEPTASADPVYLALALGGLAAAGAALAEATGGTPFAALPGLLALAALGFRSLTLVPLALLLVGLLLVVPNFHATSHAALRVNDLVLVTGTLAYLAGASRHASRANPGPNSDLGRIGLTILAAVLAGQAAISVISGYDLDWTAREFLVPTKFRAVANLPGRAVVSLLILALTAGVAGFALWYARLASQTREQSRVTLLDTAWAESRRELSRQALFRARRRAPKTRISTRAVVTMAALWVLLAVLTAVVAVRFFPE